MSAAISVVIPTHNHCGVLSRTLEALARQSLSPEQFEVLLVADGCTDDTTRVVRASEVPYRISFIEQAQAGAAEARNRGAAKAKAPILLFLDDDMAASRDLLVAHLRVHADHPGGVVLGYFPMEVPEGDTDPFHSAAKAWWDAVFEGWSLPVHRFTFRDFCSGNVSLPRAVFEQVGGFNPSLPSIHDYELGARLLKNRVRFRFEPSAASLHCDAPGHERALRRAAADGVGEVRFARLHPEAWRFLKLAGPPAAVRARLYWHLLWQAPALASLAAAVLRQLFLASRALGLTGPMWRFHGALDFRAYWSAVRAELGSLAAWKELIERGKSARPDHCEREIDLADDLGRLEAILLERPVDALVVRYRESVLGQIGFLPAAEPLRLQHVRFEIIQRFGERLLGLLLLDWLETKQRGDAAP
jgi:glycosyltransferase involved in cell wall biosynthesis